MGHQEAEAVVLRAKRETNHQQPKSKPKHAVIILTNPLRQCRAWQEGAQREFHGTTPDIEALHGRGLRGVSRTREPDPGDVHLPNFAAAQFADAAINIGDAAIDSRPGTQTKRIKLPDGNPSSKLRDGDFPKTAHPVFLMNFWRFGNSSPHRGYSHSKVGAAWTRISTEKDIGMYLRIPAPARFRGVLIALAICTFTAFLPADGSTRKGALLPADIVYVESNNGDLDQNAIFAFRRAADGSLTQIPGSPFLTGGTGVFDLSLALGPFDSDQNMIVDKERGHLFAVNSGSNTIAVFDILPDGSLKPVKGSPFPSGGINPVSLGLKGDILTVVNMNNDPRQSPNAELPNYTTFRVNPNGKLIPVPFSTVEVPAGSNPTQALISPLLPVVFGADFFGGRLQSLQIEPNGRLEQNPPQELPASEYVVPNTPRFPLGLIAHPKYPIVYVGFVTINRLGVYTYDQNGVLHFVRTVPNSGAAICWLVTNKAGTRLYSGNTGDDTTSVYDLSDPLNPVEIQTVQLNGGGNPLQLTLDADEEFLHIVKQRVFPDIPLGEGNSLAVLKVNPDGTVTEVPSSPTPLPAPPGTRSQGVVAF